MLACTNCPSVGRTKSISLWLPHSDRWNLILHALYLFALSSLTPPLSICPSLSNCCTMFSLCTALTITGTHYKFFVMYYSTTPTHYIWQQIQISCRSQLSWVCRWEGVEINITLLTAHQLMFTDYQTQHLKKETTFHLCLEQIQLQKKEKKCQVSWSVIKLRQFMWLSALHGRHRSQHSFFVIMPEVFPAKMTKNSSVNIRTQLLVIPLNGRHFLKDALNAEKTIQWWDRWCYPSYGLDMWKLGSLLYGGGYN